MECIFAMSTGQGFAGILMNLTRYITLLAFTSASDASPEEDRTNKFRESLVFFSFSGFICFLCVICTMYLYRNEYFIRKTSSASISNVSNIEDKDFEKIKINSDLLEVTKYFNILNILERRLLRNNKKTRRRR